MLTIAVFLFLLREYNCHLVLPTWNNSLEVNPYLAVRGNRPINSGNPPKYFDWRDNDAVSPVKSQQDCEACWAFSVIANIESHRKIYLNVKELLSEQFLIDCDDANKGCGYASIIQTFANIATKFGGVLRDQDYYPYSNGRRNCRWQPAKHLIPKLGLLPFSDNLRNPQPKPVSVVGFRRVFPDEDVMAEFLYKYGPLSAAINSQSMNKYTGGIDEPSDENCNPKVMNHAVLIVGYNVYESKTGEKVPYWIIKNSWGTTFGDNGFYYLVRGRNACGITTDVSFAFVN